MTKVKDMFSNVEDADEKMKQKNDSSTSKL